MTSDFEDIGSVTDPIGGAPNHVVFLAFEGKVATGLRIETAPGAPPFSAADARELGRALLKGADELDRLRRPGALLRSFRETSGRTMGDVARAWGGPVTVMYVSNLERDQVRFCDDVALEAAPHYALTNGQLAELREAIRKRDTAKPDDSIRLPAPSPHRVTFRSKHLLGRVGNITVHVGTANIDGALVSIERKQKRLLYPLEARALAALLAVAGEAQ